MITAYRDAVNPFSAFMTDIDETAFCSNGLGGHKKTTLDQDSYALAERINQLRQEAGLKCILNTGKEFPWDRYKIADGSQYRPILPTVDAIICGGGAKIFIPNEDGSTSQLESWRTQLLEHMGTDDLLPIAESLAAGGKFRLLGTAWSEQQFISDPLRVSCQWEGDDFDIVAVDEYIKAELGQQYSAFIYPVLKGAFGICPSIMNKAESGKFLLNHFGIPHSSAIFSGDSMNDLHAFQYAGWRRILVGNADPELRREVAALDPSSRDGVVICPKEKVAAGGVLYGIDHFLGRGLENERKKKQKPTLEVTETRSP